MSNSLFFFSKNLAFLRKKKDLTLDALSEKLQIGLTTLHSYEKGSTEPRLSSILKLMEYFSVDFDNLIFKDLEKEPYLKDQKFELPDLENSSKPQLIDLINSLLKKNADIERKHEFILNMLQDSKIKS